MGSASSNYRIHPRALFQHWATFDIDVEQVNLLVALYYGTLIIDPDESVLRPIIRCRFMNSDIDMKLG